MNKILIVGVLVVLIVGLMVFLSGKNSELPEGSYDNFAICLTEKGLKMYGTEWCSHCKNQKEIFGNSFQYIDYIDCDKRRSECLSAGIRGYPTWVFNGQQYSGEQNLKTLSELTGCDINQ
ncbi:MAG: hypothetical protein GF368_05475 [Candidatus Aenigmarchaeota archaeon]|nr:hypothetical protein [Candidatus Aenigmarchaeota archaeon]